MRISRWFGPGAMALAITLATVACGGSDPTLTPRATATPIPAPQATATPVPTPTALPVGATPQPTPTSAPAPQATPTPTPVPPPPGFDAEEYFGGKTIRIITGTSPGGGFDVFSRLVAAIGERYFPESTKFIVQNLPGAGQYRGLKAVLDSEPDGLTIGPVHSRWFQRQVLVGDIPNFDLDEVYILGSPSLPGSGDVTCVDRSIATSWEEVLALGRPLTKGSTAPGNDPAVEFMEANGGPFKMVYGYGGSSEIMAAFDRGETDVTSRCTEQSAMRLFPEWIEEGRLVPLFYVKNPVDDEYLARLGHTGPLPSFLELPGLNVNTDQLAALQGNLLITDISRAFIMPAGIPDDITQYWQAQFDQMMVDPAFIESVIIAGYENSYGYGRAEGIRDIVRRVQALDQNVKDILLEISGVGNLNVN